jgi:hypothetical protein
MFGYVKVDKPECKIREFEYYRAVYCGLCRALGGCGGTAARLTLTYDFTFMTLVRMALEEEKPKFLKRRCVVHPLRRHAELAPCGAVEFCARASILLSYRKLCDDVRDEKGMRRLCAKLARAVFRGAEKRAAKGVRELENSITERLLALGALESDPPPSVDMPAMIFGGVMADVLGFGLEGSREKIARAVGMAVGKWVYIVDALDDFDEDVKKGRYNPLLTVYGAKPLDREVLDRLSLALSACLADAQNALDLLFIDDADLSALIRNILGQGMPRQAKEIMTKKESSEDE